MLWNSVWGAESWRIIGNKNRSQLYPCRLRSLSSPGQWCKQVQCYGWPANPFQSLTFSLHQYLFPQSLALPFSPLRSLPPLHTPSTCCSFVFFPLITPMLLHSIWNIHSSASLSYAAQPDKHIGVFTSIQSSSHRGYTSSAIGWSEWYSSSQRSG